MNDPRRTLLELFDAALLAVDGRARVADALRAFEQRQVALFAVGKAASAMTRGAFDALGDRVRQALVITKDGHVDSALRALPHLDVLESAHPVPDERSLRAGAELERRIERLPGEVHPVFLVSGGSSSLAELLRGGCTLEQLRALNERGLASGWDIARLNTERSRLSRLKAGGVSRMLDGRPAHALFISDVPDDDPRILGSGLLGPRGEAADRVQRIVVANLETATRQVIEAAAARGLRLGARTSRFTGDAADVAREFVEALRETSADGLVWGGESTVHLPERPGRGGRNQHLALAITRAWRPDERFMVLAAGTDGSDGPTEDAGALVDAGTLERAELAGVDAERAFRDCDSGTALEAAQDLVHTGPTGTNVGDILIGIKQNARRVRDPAAARML